MKERAILRRTDTLTRPDYYPVLYALRFVLAFWVAVDHYETIPLFGGPITSGGLLYILQRGWNTVTFGTPAVIVFFVISGFLHSLALSGQC